MHKRLAGKARWHVKDALRAFCLCYYYKVPFSFVELSQPHSSYFPSPFSLFSSLSRPFVPYNTSMTYMTTIPFCPPFPARLAPSQDQQPLFADVTARSNLLSLSASLLLPFMCLSLVTSLKGFFLLQPQ